MEIICDDISQPVSCLEPFVKEIEYMDPLRIFTIFAHESWSMFLDSANGKNDPNDMNRYSYIVVDPFIKITFKNYILNYNNQVISCNDPFEFLKKKLSEFKMPFLEEIPPFQGGAVGYFSYDLCHYLENIVLPENDDMRFDEMAIGFYDLILSFDHIKRKAWIVSTGFPRKTRAEQQEYALGRMRTIINKLKKIPKICKFKRDVLTENQIQVSFSREEYVNLINKTIKYIRMGDIFEANLTQRFICPMPNHVSVFDLYQRLRLINPAPFAAYLNLDGTKIVSASPERFLHLQDRMVETRPIKGTRKRSSDEKEDRLLANELKQSIKDQSENIMIVDLMRNDLSKICEDNSIRVTQLCGLETFATVHHLVSVIKGKLKMGFTALDLLKATIPGGSITGAPKIRAMEIISELERTRRGPYCGNIAYIGFNGNLDSSIVIRTYTIKDSVITFQAGGAIVLDSDPVKEYEEVYSKAFALLRALLEKNIK